MSSGKGRWYRRLSKEDELSILSSEFENLVENLLKAADEYMSLSR